MCHYNANVAASLERPDLVQAWCLAALVISQPLTNAQSAQGAYQGASLDTDTSWSLHPFGQNLIHSLYVINMQKLMYGKIKKLKKLFFRIQHYANQSDIQMAGMLSCAFSCRSENSDMSQNRSISKSVNVSVSVKGIKEFPSIQLA